MADNTHGFDGVAEITTQALLQFIKASWKSSGERPGSPPATPGIPEYIDVDPGASFGGFAIKDGKIYLPVDGLTIDAVPPDSLRLGLELKAAAQLQSPPVPDATLIPLHMKVSVVAKIDKLPPHVSTGPGDPDRPHDVGILLSQLARNQVTATFLDGDPIAANLDVLIPGLVHKAFSDYLTAPWVADNQPIPYEGNPAYTVTERLTFQDGPSPTPAIQVATSGAPVVDQVVITIPVQLEISKPTQPQLLAPLQPTIVTSQVTITAAIVPISTGGYKIDLGGANPVAGAIAPLPDPSNTFKDHYDYDVSVLGVSFDMLLKQHIEQLAKQMLGLVSTSGQGLPLPQESDITTQIEDQMWQWLTTKVGDLDLWPPDVSQDVPINDVSVTVVDDVVAIALNSHGGDASAITKFVPAGRQFALALSKDGVSAILEAAKKSIGGLPQTFSGDKDVRLNSFNLSLAAGALHIEGSITIIDAIAGSIDVDADFSDDIALHWLTTPDITVVPCGERTVLQGQPGTPDVDTHLSVLAWLVSFLVGFVTGGALGAVIALIIDTVAKNAAASMGVDFVKNPAFQNLFAWPVNLPFGTACAHFEDPVDISPDGIVFSG